MHYRLIVDIKQAFKLNLVPGLFLQTFALTICLSYYFFAPARPFFEFFADLKTEWGSLYAFVSTSIFGGIIPFCYLYLSGRIIGKPINSFLFLTLFWALKGVEIDFLYTFQSIWFGDGKDVATIIKKTFVDQFIYGILWAAPSMTIGMLWLEKQFKWRAVRDACDKELFLYKIPTVLASNMIVWIPTVMVVYLMPLPLQIPLSNLALCFFVLILAVLTGNSPQEN